jgi:hypothetical protein
VTDTWEIGLRRTSAPLFCDTPDPTPFTYNAAPAGHFWADPCLASQAGETYVFFEDYIESADKGVLGVARVDAAGRMQEPRTVLECPYHLSYPFVFEHRGEWFMVPETSAAGRIELYRAVRFPDQWVREQTLLDIAGLDTTVFFDKGCWWLITTPDIGQYHAAITLLFSAPDPRGPWTQHPGSPISTDVRTARSAGPVLQSDGKLLRVSQNCAGGYGRHVVLSEIVELTASHYRERVVKEIHPQRASDTGLHTYGRLGDWEVIDAKHRAPRVRRARNP